MIDYPEPWQLFPIPSEQVNKIRTYFNAKVERESSGRAADVAAAVANLMKATNPVDPAYAGIRRAYGVALEAASLVPSETP